jgi:hypothetical protein
MVPPSTLPVELWNIVFRSATSTPGVLDTSPLEQPFDESRSWTADIDAVDWDTKYSLALVSRKWHQIMHPYFYEHVRIRNKRRLSQLASTLRTPIDGNADVNTITSSNHIGYHVKRIDVCIKLDRVHWTEHYIENLSTICNLSPNLRIFHQRFYSGHPFPSVPRNMRDGATIRDLQVSCDDGRSFRDTLNSIALRSTVEVLTLYVDTDSSPEAHSLPQLHTLIIHRRSSTEIVSWLTSCSLPKLMRLSIALPLHDALDKFLQKHGHGINDLGIMYDGITGFTTLFRRCPSLKRLSVHTWYLRYARIQAASPLAAHQALVQIRVVGSLDDTFTESLTQWKTGTLPFLARHVHPTNFPNLRSIQFTDIPSAFFDYLLSPDLDDR